MISIRKLSLLLVLLGVSMFFFSCLGGVILIGEDAGTVKDTNGNPLKEIVVTNGFDVTTTNEEGKFTLPRRSEVKFIYLSLPAGYHTNDWYQTVYIADASNSSNRREEFNFVLKEEGPKATEEVNFIHFTDTETTSNSGGWLDDLKGFVADTNPDFLIHTGDICYVDGMEYHAKEVTSETLGAPTFYCIGNHDLVDVGPIGHGETLYEDLFGPVYYSFNKGGVHFIVTPMWNGDAPPSYSKYQVGKWLEKELALIPEGTPIVGFNHDLLTFDGDFKIGPVNLSQDYNFRGWAYGHWHINYKRKHKAVEGKDAVISWTVAPPKGGIDHSAARYLTVNMDTKGKIEFEGRYPFGWEDENTHGTNETLESGIVHLADLGAETFLTTPVVKKYSNGKTLIFLGTTDDTTGFNHGVIAVDEATGAIVDKEHMPNSVYNDIALYNNYLCVVDVDTNIKIYDISNSEAPFQEKKFFQSDMKSLAANRSSCVVDKNGILYAGFSHTLKAIDLKTMEILWTNKAWNGGEGTVAKLLVADNSLIAGSHWRGWYNHKAESGKLNWSLNDDDIEDANSIGATPVIDGDDVLFSVGTYIHRVNLKDGTCPPEDQLNTGYNLAITGGSLLGHVHGSYHGNVFYLPTVKDGLVCIKQKVAQGEEKPETLWKFKTGKGLIMTSPYHWEGESTVNTTPLLIGASLYFGATDGKIYRINANTGAKEGEWDVGAPFLANFTYDEEQKAIYAVDFAGHLWKLPLE